MGELGVFSRQATRMVRDWCRDSGQVPGIAALVSRGWSPRKLVADFGLHVFEDQLGARAEVQRMVREHESRYAAVAKKVAVGPHGLWMLFVAVDADGGVEKWAAPVDVSSGLGGWQEQEFEFAEGWLHDSLAAQTP